MSMGPVEFASCVVSHPHRPSFRNFPSATARDACYGMAKELWRRGSVVPWDFLSRHPTGRSRGPQDDLQDDGTEGSHMIP